MDQKYSNFECIVSDDMSTDSTSEKIDDIWYLSADLSIECFNSKWNGYAVGSAFLMIIYVFGGSQQTFIYFQF